jgi:hypothetical protein
MLELGGHAAVDALPARITVSITVLAQQRLCEFYGQGEFAGTFGAAE